jgi:hypothetical protein
MKPGYFVRLGIGLVWMGCASCGLAEVAERTPESDADNEVAVLDTDGNPYRAIVARNAFRLKEPVPAPPPPTNAPPPPEQPKVDVKLAGLAEIKGVRYAYLMVPDADRPGQFQYPTLTDNPDQVGSRVRHQSVEVREINIKAQTVRLVNGGVEATINFKDNGVKNIPSAAPAGKPGAPGQPGMPPRPAVNVGAAAGMGAARAPQSEAIVFSRNPNRASGGGMNAGVNPAGFNAGGGMAQPLFSGGGGSDVVVPARPVRTTGGAVNTQPGGAAAQPGLTLEQEYQSLIRQRQVADQMGIQLPPIPGVPMPTDPTP